MKYLHRKSVLDLGLGLLLCIMFIDNVVEARTMDLAAALKERGNSAPGRELKASSKTNSLEKRHTEFVLTKEIEVNYAEGMSFPWAVRSVDTDGVQERVSAVVKPISQLVSTQSLKFRSYF